MNEKELDAGQRPSSVSGQYGIELLNDYGFVGFYQ